MEAQLTALAGQELPRAITESLVNGADDLSIATSRLSEKLRETGSLRRALQTRPGSDGLRCKTRTLRDWRGSRTHLGMRATANAALKFEVNLRNS